jgi:Concanavalin A-like lectin/glucanases superfamily/Secretion system C-terminal sorting domain
VETSIAKTQSPSGYGFSNIIFNNTDQCEFRVVNASGLGGVYTSSAPIITSSWHHIVSVVSSTTRSIYYDGVLNTSTPAAGYYYGSNTAPLTIGCQTNLASWYLGKLDDIGIWNRPLTQSEITALFLGSTVGINETSLSVNVISLFPNPATNELRIENAELKIKEIEIYSVLGEKVFFRQPETSNTKLVTVNVSQLPSGIYFVRVKTDKEISTAKFVKE